MNKTTLVSILAVALLAFPLVSKAQTMIDFTDSNVGGTPVEIGGQDYFWLCMDIFLNYPTDNVLPYNLTSDPSSLISGNQADITAGEMATISSAIVNMYLNNQDSILNSSGYNTTAYDFQVATWYLVRGAATNRWSDTLDATVINNLIDDSTLFWIRGNEEDVTTPGFGDLMLSSLNTVPESMTWDIQFGTPSGVDNQGFQPLMFLSSTPLPVPEPSSVLFIGLAGALTILRRKRAA